MLKYKFYLDDQSCWQYGIYQQEPIKISGAEPVVETIHIPGRNGDLTRYTGEYKNRKGSVKCWSYKQGQNGAASNTVEINKFLLKGKGYRKLSIVDDKDHFWLARIINGAEINDRLNVVNTFTIDFDIMPQWWRTDGVKRISISEASDHSYINRTENIAKPICYLKKTIASSESTPTTFTINGNSIVFEYPANRTVVIVDCEKQIVTTGTGEFIPCQFYQFPFLNPGTNTFSTRFDEFSVSIESREYDL